ncbi:ECF-type transport system, permease protein [Candidatus Phytoplasma solani]|uniref:energy-coupling factor transporter transmembrane component T n=1 Tax=Candidatus Phytoplasma solani TaxID=69896 RepID=UPI0032DACB35
MKKKDLGQSLRHNHPSIKIMSFLLLLFFILQLPIELKDKVFETSNLKIWALYASFFYSLVLICFSFGLSFCSFYSKIKHLRFFFFISLLLQLNNNNTENSLSLKVVDYQPFNFAIFLACLFFYYLTQKKIYFKLSYLLIILFLFFVFPTLFNNSTLAQTTYCLKLSSFLKIFLIMIRLIMIIMLFFLFNNITSFNEINDGLEIILSPLKKLKIPTQTLTLMLSLIFMAHSFLLQETNKILKAQMSRGMDLNKKNIFKKINHLLSLLVPIFVLVFKRSIVLSNAMEIRGYVLGAKRTKMIIYHLQKKDFFLILTILMLFFFKVILLK